MHSEATVDLSVDSTICRLNYSRIYLLRRRNDVSCEYLSN